MPGHLQPNAMTHPDPSHAAASTVARTAIANAPIAMALHFTLCVAAALLIVGTSIRAATAGTNQPEPVRIVAFGDSLIAGYGLRAEDAFPEQLAAALRKKHPNVEIINAGVSGDTTGAALSRLDWAFPDNAHGAIVLLGGNDFLRGLSPKRMRNNLDAIVGKLKARDLNVLLMGMRAARNTGKSYYEPFDAAFPAVAKKHDVLLERFFLEGVAGTLEFNQIDGIHPNARGVAKIVGQVLPKAKALVERIIARRTASTTN